VALKKSLIYTAFWDRPHQGSTFRCGTQDLGSGWGRRYGPIDAKERLTALHFSPKSDTSPQFNRPAIQLNKRNRAEEAQLWFDQTIGFVLDGKASMRVVGDLGRRAAGGLALPETPRPLPG
jgi:hypothetical protein